MRTVNLAYIRLLYDYLIGIGDDEIEENFDMDRPADRSMFFREAAKNFLSLKPFTQQCILDALEFVLSTPDINKYWRYIIPHDFPINIQTDKIEYVRSLFLAIAGKNPSENMDTVNVIVEDQLEPEWYLK